MLAALAGLALAAAPAASAAPTLPLGHAGRWITDADGRVVELHGMNEVAKFPPYEPAATGFGEDDAAFLAAEGYNVVRVGVIWKALEPQPGVYDDAYLSSIAATVDTLGKHGIVSLVDFHQDMWNERFQGEGAPDWAVQDDGLPHSPGLGFPGNYLAMPAVWRSFDHFWANDPGPGGVGLQDRYAAAWRHVAQRFAADKNVLGYDLLNEPWPGTQYPTCLVIAGCPLFDAQLTSFTRRVIGAIRQVDPRTLAFYEPHVFFNNGVATTMGNVGDAHAAFSFHDYCLLASDVPVAALQGACGTFDGLVFSNALARAKQTGDAVMLTEFGATDDATNLTEMTNLADRDMVPWIEWAYTGNDPTTSGGGGAQAIVNDPRQPPTGANLKAAKLKLLSRPYPQVVAGTPVSFGFDGRTFRLRYTTARAGGGAPFGAGSVSEVATPARQYPSGYAAQVDGGAILSAPGAEVLRIGSCPGATAISVTVAPTGTPSESCAAHAGARLRLRLIVSPRRAVAGRLTRFHVRVRAGGKPVRGAAVRLGGRRVRTNASGRATLRVRLRRSTHAVASRAGMTGARVTVRVSKRAT